MRIMRFIIYFVNHLLFQDKKGKFVVTFKVK